MGFRRVAFALLLVSVLSGAGFVCTLTESTVAIAAPQASRAAVEAADAAFNGKFGEAAQLAQRSDDPAAVKLVELIYLRDNWKAAGYRRIMAFLNSAPGWPYAETLLKRAERSLYLDGAPT